MQEIKKIKALSITMLVTGIAALLLFPSCQVTKNSLTHTNSTMQSADANTQFIDDFYREPVAQFTKPPDAVKVIARNGRDSKEKVFATINQRPLDDLLEEAQVLGANIGGYDYGVTQDDEASQNIALYEEQFDAGTSTGVMEKFDPTKMKDTIPVYLINPEINCFSIPITGKINSEYGWRHGRFHSGIDLDLETGENVTAAFDGVVQRAEYAGAYGNLITVKHNNGLETYYAHLSKILVSAGDTIVAGNILGLGGSTGRSTGPHLHFEIRYGGASINPKNVVDFTKQDITGNILYLNKNMFRQANDVKPKTTSAYYTIRKGDTLSKIAVKNGTTTSRLCKLNGISAKKILKPGMKLKVR